MSPLPDHLLEAVASAAVAEGLADAVYTRVPTPIGKLLVVQGPAGIVRVAFEEEPEDTTLAFVASRLGPRLVSSRRELAEVSEELQAYLEGDRDSFDVPVDLQLARGQFRRVALEQLMQIPRGSVVTYAELAARSGNPRAARAAGTACATNPIPIIVPCHRVVPGSGGVGNYGGGAPRKLRLLELEGALPPRLEAPSLTSRRS
jgi:methylated-DNA-[protein]-cysteine S-methyltransferase